MPLTDEEKVKVRHHLGYPQISSLTLMGMGVPVAGQPQWVLEKQMDELRPEAEPKVRATICECEQIEEQLKDARKRLSVSRTGDIRFRTREELEDLQDLYEQWTDVLADHFFAVKNPVSRHSHGGSYFVE